MQREFEQGQVALDPYELFVREQPEEAARIQQLVDEGRSALESGQGDRARGLFMRALSIFPWVPPALTNLAALALQRDEKEQAWHYLADLFARFPNDPAGNGVAIRYWLGRGSTPMAYHHARRALKGLAAQAESERVQVDPSAWQRASLILLSTFAGFEGDDLICELHAIAGGLEWDATALITFGIAYYNRGEIAQAERLWEACGEDERARHYRALLKLNADGVLPPFRLDYHLSARMPTLAELEQVLHTQSEMSGPFRTLAMLPGQGGEGPEGPAGGFNILNALRYAVAQGIPSLAVLDGIGQILNGTAEQAELAMGMLFLDRWPHLGELLRYTARLDQVSLRVRLGAILYLLWIDGYQAAREALEAIEMDAATNVERLLGSIVRLQIAIVGEDVDEGRAALNEAEEHLASAGGDGEEWRPLVDELTSRLEGLADGKPGAGGSHAGPTAEAPRKKLPDNVIQFPTDRGRRS